MSRRRWRVGLIAAVALLAALASAEVRRIFEQANAWGLAVLVCLACGLVGIALRTSLLRVRAPAQVVVVLVMSVIENQALVGHHLQEHHSVVVPLAVGANHVETPDSARADRACLVHVAPKTTRTKPTEHALGLDPGLVHEILGGIDDPRENDLAFELAGSVRVGCIRHGDFPCAPYRGRGLSLSAIPGQVKTFADLRLGLTGIRHRAYSVGQAGSVT